MTGRSIAVCAALLATVGCARRVGTSPASVAGQYDMTGFDGRRNLPCCSQTDSSGTVVTLTGGLLEMGWNVPNGTYRWDVVRESKYPNGTYRNVESHFSAGTYKWDGRTLTLADSAGLARMTGVVNGGIVTVRRENHEYEFRMLPQLPR